MGMVDISQCRLALRQRQEARRQGHLLLWERAQADAGRLVGHIAQHYRPQRIIQWGSVLEPDRFGPRSDIDIAVEGDFDAETWFRLLGELWSMTTFPVDLVDLRRIEPEFADIIRMKGKVVYERRPVAPRRNPQEPGGTGEDRAVL